MRPTFVKVYHHAKCIFDESHVRSRPDGFGLCRSIDISLALGTSRKEAGGHVEHDLCEIHTSRVLH